MSVCTCSVDSGRTAGARPIKCRSMAPGVGKTEAPATGLSTLNSMAFGLAVYASPDGLPAYDARLASGRWSSSTGRAFHPQDSYERFQICNLHFFPLSQACLAQSHRPRQRGNPSDTSKLPRAKYLGCQRQNVSVRSTTAESAGCVGRRSALTGKKCYWLSGQITR